MKGFASGVAFTIVLIVVVGILALQGGAISLMPDSPPGSLQRWLAKNAFARELYGSSQKTNPLAVDAANEVAGIRLYVKDCALCHGTSDGKASSMAQGQVPHPPQFASSGVEKVSSGVTFGNIVNGIKFTGMPAFDRILTETQMWQITMFLRHMQRLAPPAKALWITLPTSSDLVSGNWRIRANWRQLTTQSPAPLRTPHR